mgnify:CR=1 FL=1
MTFSFPQKEKNSDETLAIESWFFCLSHLRLWLLNRTPAGGEPGHRWLRGNRQSGGIQDILYRDSSFFPWLFLFHYLQENAPEQESREGALQAYARRGPSMGKYSPGGISNTLSLSSSYTSIITLGLFILITLATVGYPGEEGVEKVTLKIEGMT